MKYDYKTQKAEIFKEENQKLFLAVRDAVKVKLKISGAVAELEAMRLPEGIGAADSWTLLACLDRLVELGELRKVKNEQSYIYVSVHD